ncbi:hypothetical protein [Kitasatospora sp. NPDC059803]
MADGLTDSQIGRAIGRTARAVAACAQHFLQRHQLKTRPQAVRLFHAARLLDDTHPCPCLSEPGTTS